MSMRAEIAAAAAANTADAIAATAMRSPIIYISNARNCMVGGITFRIAVVVYNIFAFALTIVCFILNSLFSILLEQ